MDKLAFHKVNYDMSSETISLEIDAETARAFSATSAEERRKLELLLGLRLRELTLSSPRTLQQVLDQIGHNAELRGLTPEIMQSLLNDE